MVKKDIKRTLVLDSDFPFVVTNFIDGDLSTAGIAFVMYGGNSDSLPAVDFDDTDFSGVFIPYDELDNIIVMLQEFKNAKQEA